MTALETLLCRNCGLQASLPLGLSSLSRLTILDLGQNSFTGSLAPTFFGNFTRLKYLSLESSLLTSEIPNVNKMVQLLYFDLSYNHLKGRIPSYFPSHIQVLDLSYNELERIPTTSLRYLPNALSIELDYNELSGMLPLLNASLSLSYASFAGNKISGGDSFLPSYVHHNTSVNLANNPICSSFSLTNNSAFCKNVSDPHIFKRSSVCTTNCNGTNVTSLYEYAVSGACVCVPRVYLNITIYPPFVKYYSAVFRDRIISYFSASTQLDGKQIWIDSAVTRSDGSISLGLSVFGVGQAPLQASYKVILQAVLVGNESASGIDSIVPSIPGVGYIRLVNFDLPVVVNVSKTTAPPSPMKNYSGVATWVIIVATVVPTIGIVLIVGAIVLYTFVRGQKRLSSFTIRVQEHFVRAIPLSEVQLATKDFSDDLLLGSGGFGNVYKGVTSTGDVWAVKRAKTISMKGLVDFQNEVDIISRVNHANIVKLLGYCDERNEQILVYEFMARGSLRSALEGPQGSEDFSSLTFNERVEIAVGAAEGLRYLHNFVDPPVIHRDIKSDNILLNANLKAAIADFGLLKNNPDGSDGNAMKTRLAGTMGYMDPEYYTGFRITTKSDVYSFGVVLLELITGRRAIVHLEPHEVHEDGGTLNSLSSWIQPHVDSVESVVDPALGGVYDLEALHLLWRLAIVCIARTRRQRPNMDEVTRRLSAIKSKVLGEVDMEHQKKGVDMPQFTLFKDSDMLSTWSGGQNMLRTWSEGPSDNSERS
eukprot:TRINITY_DN2213_c0_g2_i4.p1 TRINITY_DN2213_c0_g2~~TRINITY_DN2213_c0_g2_i4.p1  ORF type:complete len:762 (+),score=35.83 TRINITY_DN2213_c0_g2_i4:267-2552(+)